MDRRLPLSTLCTSTGLALVLSACLDRDGGGAATAVVDLSTGSGDSSTGIVLSTGSTSFPEIMTTTLDPVDTDTSDGTSTGGGSTTDEPIPPGCGNGVVDDGEECDKGDQNDNYGLCTLTCKWAKCGDGYIREGIEVCDDGKANGSYGACASDCSGPGPRCGDGVVQKDKGEYCDELDPFAGCLKECTYARSCLELKQSWGDEAVDGVYQIHRMSQWLPVWCAMSADGGAYTILKHAGTGSEYSAAAAEQRCKSQYGMQLVVPRSPAHLQALAAVAASDELAPANETKEDVLPGSPADYLAILGIYPVTAGQSCVGKPLNSTDCPEWRASDDGAFWVSDSPLTPGQPGTLNCDGCSLEYIWDDKKAPPTLVAYDTVYNGGVGAKSTHFLCDVGDKKEP